MKVAITGKGGVGKTTLSASLARAWSAQGLRVVAVAADCLQGTLIREHRYTLVAALIPFEQEEFLGRHSQRIVVVDPRSGYKSDAVSHQSQRP